MRITKKTRKAIFARYFKERKLYSGYMHNVKRPNRWRSVDDPYSSLNLPNEVNFEVIFERWTDCNWRRLVQFAFDWASTREGRFFWIDVNSDYIKFISEINN